jgi:hypothetical protein
MHEKDDIVEAMEHGNIVMEHGSIVSLIAATSNEASDRCLQVQNGASFFLHWRSIN